MKFFLLAACVLFAACKDEHGPKIEVPPEADIRGGPSALAGASTSTVPKTVLRSHYSMGTQITITAWTTEEARAVATFEQAFAEMDRLDALLSVWKENSDVIKVNNAAGEAPVHVGPEALEAIERGLEGSKLTEGKFDITFGALSGLWKFDHDQDNTVPPVSEVAKRLPMIGWEHVKVDHDASTVFLEKKGMKIHLGGIGKGFAVDKAVVLLRSRGFKDFMVQFGGDLYVAGRHGDRAWRVGIRDPRGGTSSYFAAAEVTDATFSTSGDYERYFIKDGKRYHHILDPDTGSPAMACRSVTIMAKDATTAEYLSKGVFILGPERGLPLVERTEGAGAVVVDAHNKVWVSKRLEGKVKMLSDPTDAL